MGNRNLAVEQQALLGVACGLDSEALVNQLGPDVLRSRSEVAGDSLRRLAIGQLATHPDWGIEAIACASAIALTETGNTDIALDAVRSLQKLSPGFTAMVANVGTQNPADGDRRVSMLEILEEVAPTIALTRSGPMKAVETDSFLQQAISDVVTRIEGATSRDTVSLPPTFERDCALAATALYEAAAATRIRGLSELQGANRDLAACIACAVVLGGEKDEYVRAQAQLTLSATAPLLGALLAVKPAN